MKKYLVFLLAVLFLITSSAYSFKFKKFFKKAIKRGAQVAGVGFLVKKMAGPLNDFINTLLMNHGAASKDFTKVVPVVAVGEGVKVGAVQVSGPKDKVALVKAVIAIGARFSKDKRFHVEAFVPSSTTNPLKIRRVNGVGVSAIIEYKL